jgi:hypothetical protein
VSNDVEGGEDVFIIGLNKKKMKLYNARLVG